MDNRPLQYFRSLTVSEVPEVVKNTAGTVFGIRLVNTNASVVYCKIYNKATTPTVGTDLPIGVIKLESSGTVKDYFEYGLYKASLGIYIVAVTGLADTDTTAPTTDIYAEVIYK